MAKPASKSVLQRKADSARARRPHATITVDHGQKPSRALTRAIKRAGLAYEPLEAEPRDASVAWDQSLAEVTEVLPEGGLLVILESDERIRGVMHLHQGLLDALIEVQTTGQVDSVAGPARPATQIDAALSRDYVDLVLSAFEAELAELASGDLVAHLRYGTILSDRRQMPLLLPEKGFHLFRANVEMAEGARLGALLLALPGPPGSDGRAEKAARDPAWKAAFHRTLAQARVPFDAILLRRAMGLTSVLGLTPGDMIPFSPEALDLTRLEDHQGRAVMRGRLGQSAGARAVRLSLGAVDGPHPAAVSAPGRAAKIARNSGPLPEGDAPDHAADPPPDLGDLVDPADAEQPDLVAESVGLPPLGDGGLPPLGEAGLPDLSGAS